MIIAVPSLRTLGNIFTASDDLVRVAIEQGVLQTFDKLLKHDRKAIRKEICWSLSNVTAGSPELIQICLDMGLFDNVLEVMRNDS